MDGSSSPSGRYKITFDSREVFNTCWVETPTLVDTRTGETLLAFKDTHWSADRIQWKSDSVVVLELRKYPGNHVPNSVYATVDCSAGSGAVGSRAPRAIAMLERDLEAALTWQFAKPEEERREATILERLQEILRRLKI
jgi:hypothetical protein